MYSYKDGDKTVYTESETRDVANTKLDNVYSYKDGNKTVYTTVATRTVANTQWYFYNGKLTDKATHNEATTLEKGTFYKNGNNITTQATHTENNTAVESVGENAYYKKDSSIITAEAYGKLGDDAKKDYTAIAKDSKLYSYQDGKNTVYTESETREVANATVRGNVYSYMENGQKVYTQARQYAVANEAVDGDLYTREGIYEEAATYTYKNKDVTETTTVKDYFKDAKNADKLAGVTANEFTITGRGRIAGSFANDTIVGSDRADRITTGAGKDSITAGKGNDTITIDGAGDKTINIANADGNDVIYGAGTAGAKTDIVFTDKDSEENAPDLSYSRNGKDLVITREYFVPETNRKGKLLYTYDVRDTKDGYEDVDDYTSTDATKTFKNDKVAADAKIYKKADGTYTTDAEGNTALTSEEISKLYKYEDDGDTVYTTEATRKVDGVASEVLTSANTTVKDYFKDNTITAVNNVTVNGEEIDLSEITWNGSGRADVYNVSGLDKNITISDRGGRDTLNFTGDTKASDIQLAFDVNNKGKAIDDLLVTNSDGFDAVFDDGDTNGVAIENYFGKGKVETVNVTVANEKASDKVAYYANKNGNIIDAAAYAKLSARDQRAYTSVEGQVYTYKNANGEAVYSTGANHYEAVDVTSKINAISNDVGNFLRANGYETALGVVDGTDGKDTAEGDVAKLKEIYSTGKNEYNITTTAAESAKRYAVKGDVYQYTTTTPAAQEGGQATTTTTYTQRVSNVRYYVTADIAAKEGANAATIDGHNIKAGTHTFNLAQYDVPGIESLKGNYMWASDYTYNLTQDGKTSKVHIFLDNSDFSKEGAIEFDGMSISNIKVYKQVGKDKAVDITDAYKAAVKDATDYSYNAGLTDDKAVKLADGSYADATKVEGTFYKKGNIITTNPADVVNTYKSQSVKDMIGDNDVYTVDKTFDFAKDSLVISDMQGDNDVLNLADTADKYTVLFDIKAKGADDKAGTNYVGKALYAIGKDQTDLKHGIQLSGIDTVNAAKGESYEAVTATNEVVSSVQSWLAAGNNGKGYASVADALADKHVDVQSLIAAYAPKATQG